MQFSVTPCLREMPSLHDYDLIRTRLPLSALSIAPNTMARLLILSVQTVCGVRPLLTHHTNSLMSASWPLCATGRTVTGTSAISRTNPFRPFCACAFTSPAPSQVAVPRLPSTRH